MVKLFVTTAIILIKPNTIFIQYKIMFSEYDFFRMQYNETTFINLCNQINRTFDLGE